jgi:hypothetical protein
MLGNIDNNDLHKINVWKSKVPHNPQEFKNLMESKEMKTIKLTKNYILEGNIIPKGTVVCLQEEKLDFLPEEIWNKACDIKDEHERFEFVKAELNKLGTNYNDDEIEDFLNKYKNDLKESLKEKNSTFDDDFSWKDWSSNNTECCEKLKEILKGMSIDEVVNYLGYWWVLENQDGTHYTFERNKFGRILITVDKNKTTDIDFRAIKKPIKEAVEGLDDMIEMIDETLKSENIIAKEDFGKIIELAKKDKALLDAWGAMTKATDKQFNKTETTFWNRFDDICAEFKKSKEKEEK